MVVSEDNKTYLLRRAPEVVNELGYLSLDPEKAGINECETFLSDNYYIDPTDG
jgi:hypothetical protein